MLILAAFFLVLVLGGAALLVLQSASDQGLSTFRLPFLDRVFPPDPEDFDRRRGSPQKQLMLSYAYALRIYVAEYGGYPHSPEGEGAALRQLRPFLPQDSATLSTLDIDGDGARRNKLFTYMNKPNTHPDALAPDVVILAERKPDSQGGRWCVLNDGTAWYLSAKEHAPETHAPEDSPPTSNEQSRTDGGGPGTTGFEGDGA